MGRASFAYVVGDFDDQSSIVVYNAIYVLAVGWLLATVLELVHTQRTKESLRNIIMAKIL